MCKYSYEVKDEGDGIDEKNIPRLFVDFGKLEDEKQKNLEGTGLGLSICKMLVEQLNGKIKVKSKKGEGTTFSMKFTSLIDLSHIKELIKEDTRLSSS